MIPTPKERIQNALLRLRENLNRNNVPLPNRSVDIKVSSVRHINADPFHVADPGASGRLFGFDLFAVPDDSFTGDFRYREPT